MNIKDYLDSGILETYLLGDLLPDEAQEVETLAAKHPEIKRELEAIEETLELLAEKGAQTPPGRIKEQLMGKIMSDAQTGSTPEIVTSQGKGRSIKLWRLLAAASVALALISSLFALNFWNEWKNAEGQLGDLLAQNQRMAEDFQRANLERELVTSQLDIIGGKDFQKVTLPGLDSQPNALAFVYWNAASQDVYLSVSQLPEIGQDQQYQLWALVDGKPIDAGVFDLPNVAPTLLKMIGQPEADAFAITLEPRGGSESPTLSALKVMGNV